MTEQTILYWLPFVIIIALYLVFLQRAKKQSNTSAELVRVTQEQNEILNRIASAIEKKNENG